MNIAPYTVIFLGPQGSGKGTQIELLEKAIRDTYHTENTVNIQTGRRFRALAALSEEYTERRVAETINDGTLQPLFISVMLWADAMRSHVNPESHVLIDGFPRTVAEAEVLESALTFYERGVVHVVNLVVSHETARERMYKRARSDDVKESIESRLAWYEQETDSILGYYRNRENTIIHMIDGEPDVDVIHKNIVESVGLSI